MQAVIELGTEVKHAGQTWKVQRILGVEAVLLRSSAGNEVAADPALLRPACSTDPIEPYANCSDELRYSAQDLEQAEHRRRVLSALARSPVGMRTKADVTRAAAELGITPRRVWSLLGRLRTHGDVAATFLPVRSSKAACRLRPRVEAIVQQAIDQHYAKSARPSLQSLVREVAGCCNAAAEPAPSYKAVGARVRTRNQAWLVQRREGSAKARPHRLLTGAHPGAQAPWERVQIDSTPCDIRLVREDDRRVVGRPNVTFAIDIFSRVVLGFSVSLEAASTLTVATCITHACLPKNDWLSQRELTSIHWPVWGKPVTLEYDQGSENEAQGIQRGLRLHGIQGKVRAKGHPEHHGTIERLIGTMMRRVHERRGSTRGSIAERGEIDPDETACLTLPELERILALEIDSYNHTVHAGIGERPLDRYVAYFQRTDLPEGSRLPPLLPVDRLLLDFMPFERRRLVRTGFRLFRVDYSCGELLAMWQRQNGADIERVLTYDPRSLATVWVADDVSGDYIAVPYRVPRPDITLAESQAARASLQTLKAADRTEARLFDNVLKVRAIEQAGRTTTSRMRAERSRQARRAAARPSRSAPLVAVGDIQEELAAPIPLAAPTVITAFEDVEDL